MIGHWKGLKAFTESPSLMDMGVERKGQGYYIIRVPPKGSELLSHIF